VVAVAWFSGGCFSDVVFFFFFFFGKAIHGINKLTIVSIARYRNARKKRVSKNSNEALNSPIRD